jgi:integrase
MARPVNKTPSLEFRPGWGWRARIRGVQFRLGGVHTTEADAKIALGKLIVRTAANPALATVRPSNATLADLIEAFLRSDESPRGKQHRQKYGMLVELFDAAFGGDVAALDYDAEKHREFKAWLLGQMVPEMSTSDDRQIPSVFARARQKTLEKQHERSTSTDRPAIAQKPRYSRWSVNDFLSRVRRLMKFGRSRKFCDAANVAEVCDVPGVRHGDARESEKVGPANVEDVERTIPHLPAELRPLVRIQLLCGARAGELLPLRRSMISRSVEPWAYSPGEHKGKWRGGIRVIYFGPKARAILTELFARVDGDDYLFSPQRSRPNRTGRLAPRPHYSRHSYSHAINDACLKAGVPGWTSHQLRHRCGTDVRQQFGYDAAQAVLGHAAKTVTDRYSWSETSGKLAREVMEGMG